MNVWEYKISYISTKSVKYINNFQTIYIQEAESTCQGISLCIELRTFVNELKWAVNANSKI